MGKDSIELQYTELPQSQSAGVSSGRRAPIGTQLIFANEIRASCGCINGLIEFYNKLYRFGYLFTFTILLLATLIVAPVFGFIAAVLEGACMLVRMILRPIGRLVADAFGYGTIVALQSEKIQKELDV